MKDLSKKIFWTSLVSILIMLSFGILLVAFPETVIKSLALGLGIIFLAIGVIPIISYFRYRASGIATTFGFMMGVFCIVVGLILLMNENILNTIVPIIAGVWMIINGINKISLAMDLRDVKIPYWATSFVFGVIIVVAGVLLILDPVNGGKLVTKTIGVIICGYTILDFIDLIVVRVKFKNIKNEIQKVIETK